MHVVLEFDLAIFDDVTAHVDLDSVPTIHSMFMIGLT